MTGEIPGQPDDEQNYNPWLDAQEAAYLYRAGQPDDAREIDDSIDRFYEAKEKAGKMPEPGSPEETDEDRLVREVLKEMFYNENTAETLRIGREAIEDVEEGIRDSSTFRRMMRRGLNGDPDDNSV